MYINLTLNTQSVIHKVRLTLNRGLLGALYFLLDTGILVLSVYIQNLIDNDILK